MHLSEHKASIFTGIGISYSKSMVAYSGLSISDIFQASGCGEIIEEFEQNNEITNLFETSSTENEPPELEEPVSD